jgi:hypothetical protein
MQSPGQPSGPGSGQPPGGPDDAAACEPIAALRRDFCCRKNMLWATSLEKGISEEAFARAMALQGFVRAAGASPIAGLSVFDHGNTGHRVVYVARTGRIQIRLDPLTSHEDRTHAAEQLYELLRAASRAASQSSDSAAAADNAAGL